MLSKEYRLPSHTKLLKPFFFKSSLFTVKYVANNLPSSRFAFIVTKKKEKRAVYRNRIRRVFRSCVEEARLRIVEGYDMLFFLESGIIDKQREELLQELENFLESRDLLRT